MQLYCPRCNHELERVSTLKAHCPECDYNFALQSRCDKCGDELELLQACGAANLWCHSCNELKSKSAAIYTVQPN